jgi:hypothetical protein
MTFNLKIISQLAIGIIGYGVWAFMAYADPAQRADFLKFNIVMATGTIGLVLRDMQSPTNPTKE